jgi:hypothetical protein
MLLVKRGCSPHFKQRGEIDFGDLDFPSGAGNAEKIATSKLTFEKRPQLRRPSPI